MVNCLEKVEFLMKYHIIDSKVAIVEEDWNNVEKEVWEIKLNKIDNQAIELLCNIEKTCKKLKIGAVEYLPILSKLGLT